MPDCASPGLALRNCRTVVRLQSDNFLWLRLQAYEVIKLGMTVEAGAGRDEPNPAGARVDKMQN